MKSIVPLILCAVALVAAAPAHAVVEVAGTGEPAYTNTTTNTQWVSWQAPAGATQYRLRVTYYENNVQVQQETTGNVSASGTTWVNWAGVRSPLVEGKTYAICVQGEYTIAGDGTFSPDGSSCANGSATGKRTSTTIDRTAPAVTTTLADGAAAVKTATFGMQIGFQDNLAGPYPANFVCLKAVESGTADTDCTYSLSDACSIPATGGKDTTFGCQVNVSGLPDGPVSACVIGTDAAVPDNPTSSTQTSTASQANRATAACDRVTLDRVAPSVAISSSKATATVGETISFSSQASDATSGLAGAGGWQFGDGATGAGAAADHSYAQAGTYTVRYTVTDGAGNSATAEKVVTVTAPATSDPGTQNPGTQNPGTQNPGTQNPGTQNPGTQDPGTQNPGTQDPGPTPAPGSVQVGSVWVLAPKRFRIGSSRRLSVSVGASQAGQLTLTLVRGKKTIARLGVGLSPGATKQAIKLPKKLAAGTYSLKIGFKPSGVTWSASGSAKIAFQAAKKKKR
ncbi:MAG TPA: PKD domain-containing protein [Thermoleophilaceae bacterium]